MRLVFRIDVTLHESPQFDGVIVHMRPMAGNVGKQHASRDATRAERDIMHVATGRFVAIRGRRDSEVNARGAEVAFEGLDPARDFHAGEFMNRIFVLRRWLDRHGPRSSRIRIDIDLRTGS